MPLRGGALALAIAASVLPACSPREAEPSATPVADAGEPAQRDVLYALGGWLGRDLAGVKITEADLPEIEAGLADALLRRPPRVAPQDVAPQVQKFLGDRRAETAREEKQAARALLAEARAEPGAERTPNGVIFRSLVEGAGAPPKLTDQVKVQYEGRLRDGTVFDTTYERGEPAVFGLTKVIPCWTEALQRMKPGGKARLTCPSDLAYGDRGLPGTVLPGALLRFEVELLEVVPAPASAKP